MVADSVDLICTSPPYGDNHTTVTYGQFSILPLLWIISFLSSEAEVRKLRHICTSLYKGGDVPFPQMQLHIINEQVDSRHNINFTCDFPPMLYDVTFGYSKKTNVLRFAM